MPSTTHNRVKSNRPTKICHVGAVRGNMRPPHTHTIYSPKNKLSRDFDSQRKITPDPNSQATKVKLRFLIFNFFLNFSITSLIFENSPIITPSSLILV